jgi:aquaporin Z
MAIAKYITELIGTFFLVFTVGMCVVTPPAGLLGPIAIGSVLMVMIYAGGHISGGHYNPAVTTAVAVRNRMPASDVVPYVVAQLLGAGIASIMVYYLKGTGAASEGMIDLSAKIPQALLVEFIGTFALTFVVLNVATSKDTAGNSNYGLAIGFTVAAMAISIGPITGGAFNPAVATGGALMQFFTPAQIWVYILAELAAGIVAGLLFKYLNPSDP